jgi:hypothetical protein
MVEIETVVRINNENTIGEVLINERELDKTVCNVLVRNFISNVVQIMNVGFTRDRREDAYWPVF